VIRINPISKKASQKSNFNKELSWQETSSETVLFQLVSEIKNAF
jgi:hypothetical protein